MRHIRSEQEGGVGMKERQTKRDTDRDRERQRQRERDLPGGIVKDEFTADDTIGGGGDGGIVAADQTFVPSFVFHRLF